MKKLLVLAALLAAAVATQAYAQGPGPGAGTWARWSADCQRATDNSELAAPRWRGNGLRTVTGDQASAPRRTARGCGRGQGRGQMARRGRGGWRGRGAGLGQGQRGGTCALGLGITSTTSSAAAVTNIPPTLRHYLDTLQSSLEWELYARDYYTAADLALGWPPRFGNLANAEQNHADAVGNMITYLGGTPVYSHDTPIVPPATVAEADETCEQIELTVIAVYKSLIRSCPDPALLQTLNNIQASNYQHLSVVGG